MEKCTKPRKDETTSKSRVLKVRIRRSKANARERNRMHGLNAALDRLRSHMPIKQTTADLHSAPQKLSKIETLRLAKNYISAMAQTLQEGRSMDVARFIKILSKELSQTTANLLTGTFMGFSRSAEYRKLSMCGYEDGDQSRHNFANSEIDWPGYNVQNYFYNDYSPLCYKTNNHGEHSLVDNVNYWDGNYISNETFRLASSCIYSNCASKVLYANEW